MRPHNFSPDGRHLGRAWVAVPLSIVTAVVAALVIVSWPDATGSTADVASTGALSVQPYGSGTAYPVPSADSVFTERRHEVAEHVDTF